MRKWRKFPRLLLPPSLKQQRLAYLLQAFELDVDRATYDGAQVGWASAHVAETFAAEETIANLLHKLLNLLKEPRIII